jgi:hypothetical protein
VTQLKKSVIKWFFVIALCLWLGFSLGVFKQTILENTLAAVKSQLQSITFEKVEIAKKLASSEAYQVTDAQTIKALTEENKALHEQLDTITNKLYFYQRVVSPELLSAGVEVYSFSIDKSAEDDSWHYELVLMQSQKIRSLISGKFTLSFTYQEEEELKNITLTDLDKDASSAFKFKYFQTIDGEFTLPAKLAIEEVVLELKVRASNQDLELRYSWNSLTTTGSGDLIDAE